MSRLDDVIKKGVEAMQRLDVETMQAICFELIDDDTGELFKQVRASVAKKYAERGKNFISLKALIELTEIRVEMRFLTGAAARAQLQRRVEAVEQLALDELTRLQERVAALESKLHQE
jgi:hypothetical protein